tara:strand:- start:454 stop:1290 length:837 start_codon:yes stop_codon:yes gene_type:complete
MGQTMSKTKQTEPYHPSIRVVSLGAGVQSTVMALQGDREMFGPRPDAAIFADTQWEPKGVYEHLDWLESELSYPVYRVTAGNLREDALNMKSVRSTTDKKFMAIPLFTDTGIGRRQCTYDYKILPIRKKTRELLGLKPKQRANNIFAETWIGISWDEMQRMKDSGLRYIKNRWPLLEHKMHRYHCQQWFAENYPDRVLSKSACIGCPFHNNALWREMKNNDPTSWKDAVDFDAAIRDLTSQKQYLHSKKIPLDEVDLRNEEDMGQLSFLDECDGMCGV